MTGLTQTIIVGMSVTVSLIDVSALILQSSVPTNTSVSASYLQDHLYASLMGCSHSATQNVSGINKEFISGRHSFEKRNVF